MSILDNKEVCEIIVVNDDTDYLAFVTSSSADIEFIPEQYQSFKGLTMKPDAGDFAKWVHKTRPEMKVELRKADARLDLHSSDLWLPLVFLASNVGLPVYLNLVSSYLYERMKGSLRGEKQRIHFKRIGRNEPCYCGSGIKFKKCCISKEFVETDHVDIVQQPIDIEQIFA
ncbi:MAG TPA: SEC-C domain-containing protein [Deltaproteobacteria bacterium]|jgi:hypothetical protein|nr:SEC-C domain-containing protein [Deltaproteobacteria bacterium]HQI01364.1 SEC-C domain-containing protein [Deltaproteobacteria bacterium]